LLMRRPTNGTEIRNFHTILSAQRVRTSPTRRLFDIQFGDGCFASL
jgi:hypothetical protein